jgi:anti-sigma B factor antagonist
MTNQPMSEDAEPRRPAARRRLRVRSGHAGRPVPRPPGTPAGVVTVPVIGEIDSVTGGELEAVISRELANRPPVLVVDLSLVGFVGSTALSLLCRAREACRRQGTELALQGTAREDVLSQLRITGLERLAVGEV